MSKKFAFAGVKNNSKISDFFGKDLSKTKPRSIETNSRKCDQSNRDVILVESEADIVKITSNHDENSSPNAGHNSRRKTRESPKDKTPEKCFKSPAKSPNSATRKTPKSRGTTPRKLFERSPKKLQEFNVVVLEKFVTISPSKSNPIVKCKVTPNKRSLDNDCHVSSTSELEEAHKTIPKRLKLDLSHIPEKQSPKKQDSIKTEAEIKTNIITTTESTKLVVTETNLDEYELAFTSADFEDDFFDLPKDIPKQTLNFDEAQHCKITQVEKVSGKIILHLKSTKNGEFGLCIVTEFWAGFEYSSGSTVYICAARNKDEWIVSNSQGYVVYEPELLISSTSVARSMYCKRKSVLGEYYRGFEGGNKHMAIGTLVHSLLQIVLKQKLYKTDQIESVLKHLLKRKETLKYLYESNVELEDIEQELKLFIPKIVDFIEDYVHVTKVRIGKQGNWRGKIDEIADIEENLWCPQLGVKGKIDVSVRTGNEIKPLEIKTGRAAVSLEHRGQVMLYIMMMNKYGYDVTSGLLLYLKEGVLKEVSITPNEKRDILIMRNELAYYLTKKTKSELDLPQLPPPVDRHNICKTCAFNVVCTSLLKFEDHDLSHNENIKNVQENVLQHLKECDLEYFRHWTALLTMEENVKSDYKNLKDIYTVDPVDRERRGRSLANVSVTRVSEECNGISNHTFKKHMGSVNFLVCGILEHHYVVISTGERPAVAAGFVTEINVDSIVIALDRNLDVKYKGKIFHLDTYDSSSAYSFNLTSLSVLLQNTTRSAELRKIIIEKKQAEFSPKLPAVVAKKGAPILRSLNQVQQKAILKAISAKDFLLIQGMPGTGKTSTIVALIQVLVAIGKTVLLTSHTHSAIDNVCRRLKNRGVDFLRLGSQSRIADDLKEYSESAVLNKCSTLEELEKRYNAFNVIAVTCLGCSHPLISKRTMDYCIVDESTQVLQPSIMKPINAAKSFILIGDPEQLPPVVKNVTAIKMGMAESLFHRLSDNPATVMTLTLNYRMNQVITKLANDFTYNGELKTGNTNVANQTLNLPNIQIVKTLYEDKPWVLKVLNSAIEASVQVIDVGSVWQHSQNTTGSISTGERKKTVVNLHEIAVIRVLVDALIRGGVASEDVGVIAPYRAQVAELKAILSNSGVEVNTIDQFQGRDKNVIIFSCTKSSNNIHGSTEHEILEDKRRLTVAITRAKQKLILIGDLTTLRRYNTFSTLLNCLNSNNFIVFGDETDPMWDILNE